MGTITERRLKNGKVVYTAQIRVMRDGKKASASSTFDRRQTAEAWLKRKEAETIRPGGFDRLSVAKTRGATLADAIDKYVKSSAREIGKTKAQVLKSIKTFDIGALACADINSSSIVDFAQSLHEGGRKPQTVNNYLSHLSAIFAVAGPAWKMDLDEKELQSAMAVCKRLGLIAKSGKRDRRPTIEEMNLLMAHFEDRWRRGRSLPMHKVCAFALFSTRRQEEIVTIRWADLEAGRILVRDMKHPGEKIGNDIWVDLPPEAEAVIAAMTTKDSERIFPYSTEAVSAGFTRACKLLGISDLHFHDLRHEGVSRLFEMGKTIPQAASVSGHRSWQSLQRYSHLRESGDKWADWSWLAKTVLPQAIPK